MGRRVALAIERAARRDLNALPELYRTSAVAKSYLLLARRLDAGVSARDSATLTREMRLCLMALYELAPPQEEGDFVDEIAQRREARMKEATG